MYGKRTALLSVIGTVTQNIDKILIFHYLGAVDLAIYAFALLLPERLRGMVSSGTDLIVPKFSQKNYKEIDKGYKHKIMLMLVVLIFVVVLYALAAPWLFKIFFPQYLGSVIFTQIYAISLLSIVSIIPSSAVTTQLSVAVQYKTKIVVAVISIGLLLALIPSFGLFGAIWARVIGKLLGTLVIHYFYKEAVRAASA